MNPSLPRVLPAVLLPAVLLSASYLSFAPLRAQTSDAAPAPAAAAPQPPSASASSLLNPAISALQAALDGLRVERWKASPAAREQTENNIESVRRDLEDTLPPLLAAADAAPGSVTQVLPAYRNVEALYDVLIRISSVGRLAAPPQQSDSIDQAIAKLESSRRALGDQLQSSASSQDQKVHDLQASLRPPPPAPGPLPCPPAPAAKKRKTPPKVHPNPATTTQPGTTSSPQ